MRMRDRRGSGRREGRLHLAETAFCRILQRSDVRGDGLRWRTRPKRKQVVFGFVNGRKIATAVVELLDEFERQCASNILLQRRVSDSAVHPYRAEARRGDRDVATGMARS